MKFYVYEHWRPDKDVCFYVGKGHGKRAYVQFRRNAHHKNIRAKLARQGMCIEIRLVRFGLTEDEAFTVEKERIAFWKSIGIRLANRSDGGEGPSGQVFSPETIAKLRAKRRLRKFTAADRAAMSAGRLGMKFSDQHKANLAARKIGKPRKPFTKETLEKMRVTSRRREEAKRLKYGSAVRRNSRIREPIS